MSRLLTNHRLASVVIALAVGAAAMILAETSDLSAQPPGKGPPAGKGMKNDPAFAADREAFHFLLEHRKDVKRTVKNVENGVETLTESNDADVAKKIREHVAAMHKRVKDGKGIHYGDPLFAEIFKHHEKITMKVEKTDTGVKVIETSDDPYVAKLIQAHSAVVTKFIENGHEEVHKNHSLPENPTREAVRWIVSEELRPASGAQAGTWRWPMEVLIVIGLFALWIVLNVWVLPKAGVPT